jgi:hypothetical protein
LTSLSGGREFEVQGVGGSFFFADQYLYCQLLFVPLNFLDLACFKSLGLSILRFAVTEVTILEQLHFALGPQHHFGLFLDSRLH